MTSEPRLVIAAQASAGHAALVSHVRTLLLWVVAFSEAAVRLLSCAVHVCAVCGAGRDM